MISSISISGSMMIFILRKRPFSVYRLQAALLFSDGPRLPLLAVAGSCFKAWPPSWSLILVLTRSGHKLISVDFHNQGLVQKSASSTNAHSRFASVVVDGVLGPPRLGRHTLRCPCISVVPEAMHKVSQGPLKGAHCLFSYWLK